MVKAIWKGQVIAEAPKNELIYIEQNWYFPPSRVTQSYLRDSDTPYHCPWKGDCRYFDVGKGEEWSRDNAWCYPDPLPGALAIVKKDFSNYVAFWRDVEIEE